MDAAAAARAAIPGIPCDAEGPVFREPWEAGLRDDARAL